MRRVLSLLLITAVSGCAQKAPSPESTPPAAPRAAQPAAAPAADEGLTGPVLEHLAASPYVYLRIKTSRGEVWAAVPEAKIETGTVVTVVSPMLMTKFASSSLKRTFDEVYFGTLAQEGAAPTAAGGNPHAGVGRPAAPVEVGKVAKATAADARTVAELWDQKASLEGKTVTIHGVVVKANNGVMGKNWIHLQDGSGDAKQGTNDITVTTLEQAAKGETVTIRGTVRTKKDFGAGYTYPVMVEDAKIIREM